MAEHPVELGQQGPRPDPPRRHLDPGQPFRGQHHAQLAGERAQPVVPVGQHDDLPVVPRLEQLLRAPVHVPDHRLRRHDPVAVQGQPEPQQPVRRTDAPDRG